MLLSGEMTIVGNGYRERVKAPYVLAADGDDKRALYAHEDSVYVTVHKTDKTNLDELEKELIKDDDRYLFDSSNRLKFDVPKFRALTLKIIPMKGLDFGRIGLLSNASYMPQTSGKNSHIHAVTRSPR